MVTRRRLGKWDVGRRERKNRWVGKVTLGKVTLGRGIDGWMDGWMDISEK